MRWFFVFALFVPLITACPGDDGGPECRVASDCPDGTCLDGMCVSSADAGPRDGGDRDAPGEDTSAPCPEPCDGECVGGVCCPSPSVCGESCCGEGDVCTFRRCVAPGATCQNELDCAEGEYCEPSLGEDGRTCDGEEIPNGRCLPRPPVCADGTTPDPLEPGCVASCTFTPGGGDFAIDLAYSWGDYDGDPAEPNDNDIRNSPIVLQVDDDDCDGRVSVNDTPDIVVVASPRDTVRPDGSNPVGNLVVLSVDSGTLEAEYVLEGVTSAYMYPAGANLDDTPGNEIVVSNLDRTRARAFGVTDGALVMRWESEPLPRTFNMPSIADVDQDGEAEVIVGGVVLAGRTGAVKYTMSAPAGRTVAVDVDNDPEHRMELVSARRVYRLEGTVFEEVALLPVDARESLVVDLVPGGRPEIVSVATPNHTVHVWRLAEDDSIEMLRSDLDLNGSLDPTRCADGSAGRTRGGGPPTAADVNADGVPDIAVAGGVGYAVIDGARLVDPAVADADTFVWVRETIDCSSAQTGSSVFDFNGDGEAEVLYADEHTFYVYDGNHPMGEPLFTTCNTNGTILEMPIVADIDNDQQADIIVVSNARYRECLPIGSGERTSGVRVFSSRNGDWVRTRRIWNQHPYHVSNVEADGSVPQREMPNHLTPGLNNWRQNIQPGSEFAAVDAVVSMSPACGAPSPTVVVTARNVGEALMPAGAVVRLYAGESAAGTLLGEAMTTRALAPAQSEDFAFPVDMRIAGGFEPAFATITLDPRVQECRTDNNEAARFVRDCGPI